MRVNGRKGFLNDDDVIAALGAVEILLVSFHRWIDEDTSRLDRSFFSNVKLGLQGYVGNEPSICLLFSEWVSVMERKDQLEVIFFDISDCTFSKLCSSMKLLIPRLTSMQKFKLRVTLEFFKLNEYARNKPTKEIECICSSLPLLVKTVELSFPLFSPDYLPIQWEMMLSRPLKCFLHQSPKCFSYDFHAYWT
jgi:hypothetical protein